MAVIKYDEVIEVTYRQYVRFDNERYGGIAARRREGNRFFIKVWYTKMRRDIQKILSEK